MKKFLSGIAFVAVASVVCIVSMFAATEGVEWYAQHQVAKRQAAAIEYAAKEQFWTQVARESSHHSWNLSNSAHAGSWTDYAENKVVDCALRGQSCGFPATWYLALFTTTCTDAGPGTEVSTSGTAYARQAVTSSLANWSGTQSSGSTVASSGTGATSSNNGAITWTASTASWGTIQSVGFMDASSSGNRWICIDLTASFNVSAAGVTVSFPAGSLQFQVDN